MIYTKLKKVLRIHNLSIEEVESNLISRLVNYLQILAAIKEFNNTKFTMNTTNTEQLDPHNLRNYHGKRTNELKYLKLIKI